MERPEAQSVRGLVRDLRSITPESGVAAVLRTVAESARRAAGARFAAIVPAPINPLARLITVAVDGYEHPAQLDAEDALGLPLVDGGHSHRTTLDGWPLIRVPIEVGGAEFCLLYLTDPIAEEGFASASIEWLDDIAAVAGMAVEHAIHNEEQAYQTQWASTFDALHQDGRGERLTPVLQEIAQTALRLSQTQCAAVATSTGEFIEVRAAAGVHADRLRGSIVPAGLSLMGQVIATLKYDLVDDASTSARTFIPLSQAVELGPAVVVPLQHAGQPIGSLLLGNQQGGAPVDISKLAKQLNTDARLRMVIRLNNSETGESAAPLSLLCGTALWDAKLDFLTRRELIVFGMLGRGLPNSAIAEELFLSEKTVRNYVSNTLTKLGMRRVEAAVHAAKMLNALNPTPAGAAPNTPT